MPNKSRNYQNVIIVSTVLCVGGFIYNTFGTFEKFIQAANIVVITTQKNDQLPLPNFVVCHDEAYKTLPAERSSTNETMWQEEKYLQQTKNPEEIQMKIAENMALDATNYTFNRSVLRTVHYGRCNVINIEPEVS